MKLLMASLARSSRGRLSGELRAAVWQASAFLLALAVPACDSLPDLLYAFREEVAMDGRVLEALHQLESRMADEVLIHEVAASVGLSLFHFHRLFHQETGETPAEYLRRVRLDAAALRLRWTRDSAGEVANALGYTSQAAFSRAFRERFGTSPRRFRYDGKRWPPLPVDRLIGQTPSLRELEPCRCLARRYFGPYKRVPERWREFLRDISSHFELLVPGPFLGLVYDDPRFTPPEQIRYDCCAAVPAEAELDPALLRRLGLRERTLRGGSHACLRHEGTYRNIGHSFSRLLDHWVVSSGFTITEEPAIELYIEPQGRVPDDALSILLMVAVQAPPAGRKGEIRSADNPRSAH
jgi:AraC family transcriptional regulator